MLPAASLLRLCWKFEMEIDDRLKKRQEGDSLR